MAEEKNIHSGHRQRMLKKYLEHGIDCFEDHEILEIFLFTAYSRRNTNDISHQLINRFGSLEGVLNAGYDEIVEERSPASNAPLMAPWVPTFMNTGVSAVPWAQEKCPRRALPWVVMTSNIINSLSQEMNMASPKLKNR